tara:strand:- start:941 stop:1132 length:192 start_codon:yes stop_codon:yes gene_type:complete
MVLAKIKNLMKLKKKFFSSSSSSEKNLNANIVESIIIGSINILKDGKFRNQNTAATISRIESK